MPPATAALRLRRNERLTWPPLLLLLLLLLVLATHAADALVIESPSCEILTHVSGEFTNRSVIDEGRIANYDVVAVTPFHACETLSPMDLTDKIALVVRGECNFVQKVWNAQRANATAVVVMDNELRIEPPYHIIMQKDQHASAITIPSVFVSYEAGAAILRAVTRAPPWHPARLTLSSDGELPASKTGNSLVKRIVAYVFLVSVVCVFSSGLSLLSSALFQLIGKRRRTRASRQLPVVLYRRRLQQQLLQQLVNEQNVIDRIPLDDDDDDDDSCDDADDDAMSPLNNREKDVIDNDEMCAICLDDFVGGTSVKVLPCQHLYHAVCIEPWLERQSSCCPLCKQDAVSPDANAPPKRLFGFALPRIEQILQHEHVFHTFFLMLPASIVSCLIVNSAASIIGSLWP